MRVPGRELFELTLIVIWPGFALFARGEQAAPVIGILISG